MTRYEQTVKATMKDWERQVCALMDELSRNLSESAEPLIQLLNKTNGGNDEDGGTSS